MKLKGSCQCEKVQFTVESKTPYPFMICYCSICRKLGGALGGCNIMGVRKTLKIKGRNNLKIYHATMRSPGKRSHKSSGERWFCKECGAHLFVMDDGYPDGVWPNAASIDTPLPAAPSRTHIMLKWKPKWIPLFGKGPHFPLYPDISIENWHKKHRLLKK